MTFKPYAIAMIPWGARVFPAQAFNAFSSGDAPFAWACLVESPGDEEIFKKFLPGYAWLIKSAHKRGFGSKVLQK